jgi:hypothetical protein
VHHIHPSKVLSFCPVDDTYPPRVEPDLAGDSRLVRPRVHFPNVTSHVRSQVTCTTPRSAIELVFTSYTRAGFVLQSRCARGYLGVNSADTSDCIIATIFHLEIFAASEQL